MGCFCLNFNQKKICSAPFVNTGFLKKLADKNQLIVNSSQTSKKI